MIRKRSFLVIVALFMLFILIVNSAEEQADFNKTNTTSNFGNPSANAIKQDAIVESPIPDIEENKTGKSVSASFGVYLRIVG